MAICFACKNKVSWFNEYSYNDRKSYCKKCWNKNEEKKEKQRLMEEEKLSKRNEEERGFIEEYKRKCQECGKVWHSNIKIEKNLQASAGLNALSGISSLFFGGSAATSQYIRNTNAQTSEITNLKKCPNCGSTHYTEQTTKFRKK